MFKLKCCASTMERSFLPGFKKDWIGYGGWIVIFLAVMHGPNLAAQDLDDRYERYVDYLFQQYDKDGNGQLSSDEMVRMRRPPLRTIDSNQDGLFSQSEMFNWLVSSQKQRESGAEENSEPESSQTPRPSAVTGSMIGGDPSAFQALGDLGIASDHSTKSDLGGKVTIQAQGDSFVITGDQGDVEAVRSFMNKWVEKQSSAENHATSQPPADVVSIHAWIFRSSALPLEVEKHSGKSVAELKKVFANLEQESTSSLDYFHFSTLAGEEFRIESGTRQPIVTSVMQARGGQTTKQVQFMETGVKLEVEPRIQGSELMLEYTLGKSALESSAIEIAENENAAVTTDLQIESVVICRPGESSCVLCQQDGQKWLVCFVAEWKNRSSTEVQNGDASRQGADAKQQLIRDLFQSQARQRAENSGR